MKAQIIFAVLALCGLSACAAIRPEARPPPIPATPAPVVMPDMGAGTAAAALDQTTDAQKAAALAVPDAAGERRLGVVVVALGSPAEQGFWVKSALISVPATGRVETADGQSVAVDLIPGDGAALLSLAAFRALGLGLTDLPEVTIYAE